MDRGDANSTICLRFLYVRALRGPTWEQILPIWAHDRIRNAINRKVFGVPGIYVDTITIWSLLFPSPILDWIFRLERRETVRI